MHNKSLDPINWDKISALNKLIQNVDENSANCINLLEQLGFAKKPGPFLNYINSMRVYKWLDWLVYRTITLSPLGVFVSTFVVILISFMFFNWIDISYYQPSQLQKSEIVIPADKVPGGEAGIQSLQGLLDPRFRGG
jgi:hypothetical protein